MRASFRQIIGRPGVHGLAVLALGLSAVPAGAEPAQGLDNPVVAFNLSAPGPGSVGQQYLDFMRMAKDWTALPADNQTHDAMKLDALMAGGFVDTHGWVRSMPEGMDRLRIMWTPSSAMMTRDRAGVYLLTYDGQGTLTTGGGLRTLRQEPGRMIVEFTDQTRNAWLDIRDIDPQGTGEYIRNMTMIREDRIDLYEAGARFNPDWLALIADARQVRFLNWSGAHADTQPVAWEDRSLPDALPIGRGQPLEYMVQVANEIGADPWFVIPASATDDFIRNYATYVRDTLDPRLTIRVEYSNENWNVGFRHARWFRQQAKAAWGEPVGVEYAVKNAVRNAQIWDEVFGEAAEARLVHVLGSQAYNVWGSRTVLAAETWKLNEPEEWVDPASVFDELAIASYFGTRTLSNEELRNELVSVLQDPSQDAGDFLIQRMLDPEYPASLPWSAQRWSTHAQLAQERGMRLVAYEGGQHMHHAFRARGVAREIVELLSNSMGGFVRSEEMGQLYEAQIELWKQHGQGPYMHFQDTGGSSRWGSWGLYTHFEDSTPRSEAIEALNASNEPWWDAEPGPQYLHGVTRIGTAAADTLEGTPEEDYLIGGGGDDVFILVGGNDGVHGGDGEDLVILPGRLEDYELRAEGAGIRATGPKGSVLMVSIERVADETGANVRLDELLQSGG